MTNQFLLMISESEEISQKQRQEGNTSLISVCHVSHLGGGLIMLDNCEGKEFGLMSCITSFPVDF